MWLLYYLKTFITKKIKELLPIEIQYFNNHKCIFETTIKSLSFNAVAQWLRCCAPNRNVAGSIPADVSEFFINIKSFRSRYGPGVYSASNRNEYQEYFLGVKAAGA